VCIPLELRVRAVIEGWEYSDMVLGSVSWWGCGGDVGICGCVCEVLGRVDLLVLACLVLCVCWVWRLGRFHGGSIPCIG